MKTSFLLAAAIIAGLTACNNPETKTGGDTTKTPTGMIKDSGTTAAMPADSATIMQACTNFMEVGPMHALLAKDNGNWTDEITMWMAPGATPYKMISTSAISMVLGGRYQQAIHKGMMDGMPFEGISTTGYDNARKLFVNSWIDNMGTGMITLEGNYDSTSKTIHFNGFQTDPVTAKKMEIKQNVTFNADGTQTMTMFAQPMGGGTEYKTMEILMKRK